MQKNTYRYPQLNFLTMKLLQSGIFRAICSIIVGALLVKYREQTMTWLTVAIGALFFLSGLISCIVYLADKRNSDKTQVFDSEGKLIQGGKPNFPLVGIGSIVLGAILALAPNSFINGLMYVLAAILILGAINMFYNLASITRIAKIGVAWWVVPILLLVTGVIIIAKPTLLPASALFIIGWAMMVYGVIDLVNTIKIQQVVKAYDQSLKAQEATAIEVEDIAPADPAPMDQTALESDAQATGNDTPDISKDGAGRNDDQPSDSTTRTIDHNAPNQDWSTTTSGTLNKPTN